MGATELVRDKQIIESMTINGISLNNSPKEAFDHFYALGYRIGPIKDYEEWDTDGIEMVLGTYGSPEGQSSIVMTKKDGRLTHLKETFTRPQNKFSASELIAEARKHFGIGPDEPKCKANSEFMGNCRVQDHADPQQVTLVFGMQILPGILNRYIESKNQNLLAP